VTDLVTRSLEVIRAGQAPSGAFVAGPTFSQYGHAWLRDGSFIAEAMDLVGEIGMAARFHDWVAGVVLEGAAGIERSILAGRRGEVPERADHLHCRYTVTGAPLHDDWPAFQLDGPGIWLWSLAHHVRHGGVVRDRHARAAMLAARYLAALWQTPSADAWEESPDRVHTGTQAAMLAGLRAVASLPGMEGSAEAAEARLGLETQLLGAGDAWTKWAGGPDVDASLLWIVAPYGLVGPDHPRFAATLARVERELVSVDGGVHRYRQDTYYGGGEWVLLTAALGRTYLRRDAPGDRDRARSACAWIERQAAPDGTLPEQVATRALHPERIEEWVRAWGESARPLLWSHATYLALHAELEQGVHGAG
jgi:GH15 family glucan-1,4-alpha-glucosidase